jgi:outer membrane biogenesis lipoprotein LolB
MKKAKIFTASAVCAVVLAACAKTTTVDFNNVPDTERCQYMKDACKEAQAFQGRYERMGPEEKNEAKIILNAYIQQCEGAQELCRKSAE